MSVESSLGKRHEREDGEHKDQRAHSISVSVLDNECLPSEILEQSRFGTQAQIAQSVYDSALLPMDLAKLIAGFTDDSTSWIVDMSVSIRSAPSFFRPGEIINSARFLRWLPINNAVALELKHQLLIFHLSTRAWTQYSLFVPASAEFLSELPNGLIVLAHSIDEFEVCILSPHQPQPLCVFEPQTPTFPNATGLANRKQIRSVIGAGSAGNPSLIINWSNTAERFLFTHHPLPSPPPPPSLQPIPLQYSSVSPQLSNVLRRVPVSPTRLIAHGLDKGWKCTTLDVPSLAVTSVSSTPLAAEIFQTGTRSVIIRVSGSLVDAQTGQNLGHLGFEPAQPFAVICAHPHSAIFACDTLQLSDTLTMRMIELDVVSAPHRLTHLKPLKLADGLNTNRIHGKCLAIARMGDHLWSLHSSRNNSEVRLVRWSAGILPSPSSSSEPTGSGLHPSSAASSDQSTTGDASNSDDPSASSLKKQKSGLQQQS